MQGVVIQGPTNYCKQILDVYENIPNVVFSTWDDEPIENLNYIQSKNIPLIISPKPLFSGYLNINYQTISTTQGIHYLKNKGITEILKIRSDLLPNNITKLLELLKGKLLSFLAICKPNIRPLYYELGYIHNSFDFPVDLIVYGNSINLENCFNFQTKHPLPIPPESLIAYNYFINSGLDFKMDYFTFIKNEIDFFMKECLKNNIKIEWLKNNIDIVKLHSDINLYDY